MINDQPIQRRCANCNKATILLNTPTRCILYCTSKQESVSKFDHCKKFFYGGMDRKWVK